MEIECDAVFDICEELKFYEQPSFTSEWLSHPIHSEYKVWQHCTHSLKPRAIYDNICPERFSLKNLYEASTLVLPVLCGENLQGDMVDYLEFLLQKNSTRICRIACIYQEWQEFALDSMQVCQILGFSIAK